MYYANQFEYDNAVEPGYWDEDDSCVYDAMKEDFNEESFFLSLYEQGDDTINDLLVKVASGDKDDSETIAKLVSALQSFYQSELEKYSDINYGDKYKELKDANDDY